jgi:hypothetical protein
MLAEIDRRQTAVDADTPDGGAGDWLGDVGI